MAFQAIGLNAAPRRGLLARLCRRRQEESGRKAALASWIARQQALWARTLAPVRPFDAPRGCATDWDASWPLPRELTSVRRGRRLVTAQLGDWGLQDLADTAELLVSELVTNALCHTRGPLRLNLRVRDSHLRCEVEDTDPTAPVRRVVDADAEGGRGIDLLDLLAEAWGSTSTATGKTMWFQLPAEASSPQESPACD